MIFLLIGVLFFPLFYDKCGREIHIKGELNMGPTQETYTIVRYQCGTFSKQLDEIVTESPITIKLNGEEYVTVVCTPNYIEDMVIGF